MRKLSCLPLTLLLIASIPSVYAAPAIGKGSFAQYSRLTTSTSSGVLNGTFRWDVQAVYGEPPIAEIAVLNNQSSQITSFTFAIDLSSRTEIPSYTVASQNPTSNQPSISTDHPTKTFFWIDPTPSIGTVVDTVLGSAIVNGTSRLTLRTGISYNCWVLVSQSIGNTGSITTANATLKFWFDQKTGLLIKLDSESRGQFSSQSDAFLLQSTDVSSLLSVPLTLTAVEWASLTMSVIALILGGLAVAVAIDLGQFRRNRTKS
jgi:hypothetical protein